MALHLRLNLDKSCGKFFENAHDKFEARKLQTELHLCFVSVLAQRSISFLLNTRKSKIIKLCLCVSFVKEHRFEFVP